MPQRYILGWQILLGCGESGWGGCPAPAMHTRGPSWVRMVLPQRGVPCLGRHGGQLAPHGSRVGNPYPSGMRGLGAESKGGENSFPWGCCKVRTRVGWGGGHTQSHGEQWLWPDTGFILRDRANEIQGYWESNFLLLKPVVTNEMWKKAKTGWCWMGTGCWRVGLEFST